MELSKWNEDWFHAEFDNVARAHSKKSREEIMQRLISSIGTLHPNDGIPLERKLSKEELSYFADLVETFIKERADSRTPHHPTIETA